MNPVEYKPARRTWVREILVGTVTGVLTALAVAAVQTVASLLF